MNALKELNCTAKEYDFTVNLLNKHGITYIVSQPGYWFDETSYRFTYKADVWLHGLLISALCNKDKNLNYGK